MGTSLYDYYKFAYDCRGCYVHILKNILVETCTLLTDIRVPLPQQPTCKHALNIRTCLCMNLLPLPSEHKAPKKSGFVGVSRYVGGDLIFSDAVSKCLVNKGQNGPRFLLPSSQELRMEMT